MQFNVFNAVIHLKNLITTVRIFTTAIISFFAPIALCIPMILKFLYAKAKWYFNSKNHNVNSNTQQHDPGVKEEVIIVGAGPTGLWLAVQLKLYLPNLHIRVFEKYNAYTRERDVFLDKSSFSNAHPDLGLQALIQQLPSKIAINDLETRLLEYAKQLAVQVHNEEIQDCTELAARFPAAKVIIGADGSRSVVRKQIFNNQLEQYNVSYVVEAKYQSEDIVALPQAKLIQTLFRSRYYFKERVSTKNGAASVTLSLIVDKKTYDALGAINFNHPGKLDDDLKQRCPELYQTITVWLQAHGKTDFAVGEELKINKIELDVYEAKDVVKQQDGVTWAIVGDASIGLPFFRSLNTGLLNASQLAASIYQYLTKQTANLDDYQTYFKDLAMVERSTVGLKNLVLKSYIGKVNSMQWAYQNIRAANPLNSFSLMGTTLIAPFYRAKFN